MVCSVDDGHYEHMSTLFVGAQISIGTLITMLTLAAETGA
jgi:hypothetical protein